MQELRVITAGSPAIPGASPAVMAGGLIYVSGVIGTGDDGKLMGPDVASQTRRALARIDTTLEAAGSSLANAVNINVYLKHASDFDAMNAAYRDAFPGDPPVRTTIVADVPGFALVQMSAAAVLTGAMREVLHPAAWMTSPRPYSYIIRTDDLVFFSGLISRRGSDDTVLPGTAAEQTKTILNNAADLLEAADLTYDDVVAARVFLTDDSYFDALNEVYANFFPKNPPARATVVTPLMGDVYKVEITLIASTKGKEVLGAAVTPSLPVSAAVRAGRRVFLSGVLGTDTTTLDAAKQAREAFSKITHTLAVANLTASDVVDATIYLRGLEDLGRTVPIFREIFPRDPPALTVAGTHLVTLPAQIEVLLTAWR